MASFKLPRLKANLAIVDGKGKPADYFLRLFNIELAQRIESTVNGIEEVQADLADVVAELAEQLALIQAAQERADEAYALAETAQGSRYIDFDGPYPSVSGVINGQSAMSALTFNGSLSGATLDADSTWEGTVALTENNGGGPVSLGSVPVTISSNGLSIGGVWQTDSASFSFSVTGTLGGSVTYTATASYDSGANLVADPTISINLVTIPVAA